jgi:serine/threonine-protein kinase RsbW
MPDEVSLKFPASFEYIRLARLVASGLAAQVNFNLDDIEDLRIAVDELCSALVEAAADRTSTVTVAFRVDDQQIQMEADVPTVGANGSYVIDDISSHILRAAVDRHELEQAAERLVARMSKQCLTVN